AAIFQLVNALRLRSLPVEKPNELVSIGIDRHGKGRVVRGYPGRSIFTEPLWQEIRSQQQAFSSLFAMGQRQMGSVQRRRSGSWVWVLRQRTLLRRPWGARSRRSPVDGARRSKGMRLARRGAVAWVLAGSARRPPGCDRADDHAGPTAVPGVCGAPAVR